MSWFTLFKPKPIKKLHFTGVKEITSKDFNRRYCPNCQTHGALSVDDYETVPIAVCKYCNAEFQLRY